MKLRSAGREKRPRAPDRLSEEAFAAATIQAALATRPAAPGAPAAAAGPAGGADSLDGAVLEGLPVGIIVTDEAGVVRRCTALAREWLGIAAPGTGHPYRSVLARWPAIADGLASAHAGDPPAPFVVLTESTAAPSPRLTVAITRWTPRGGRGGAVAMLGTGLIPTAAPAGPERAAGTSRTAAHGRGVAPRQRPGARARQQPDDRPRLRAPRRSQRPGRGGPVGARSHHDELREDADDGGGVPRPRAAAADLADDVRADRRRAGGDHPGAAGGGAAGRGRAPHAGAERHGARRSRAPRGGDRRRGPQRHRGVGARLADAGGRGVGGAGVRGARASRSSSPIAAPASPTDVRARVFQPFLTDKPGHDGLGLARAAQVLRAHPGASIALEHPPAGGLVVTIALPQHG